MEVANNAYRCSDELFDCIVIGCGPAGASAALYLARAKLKTLILDKSPSSGALARCKKIENFPGISEPMSGIELIERIRKQAKSFGAICERAQVVAVNFDSDPKEVYTADTLYLSKTVIVATGAMDRRTKVPGEEKFLGNGVSYCVVCDAAFYSGKDCLVAGDGEEAIEEALLLTRFANKVYFSCPKDELEAPEDLIGLLKDYPKIEIISRSAITAINGSDSVESVKIATTDGEKEIPVSGVFILTGGTAATTGFLGGALPLGEDGCLLVGTDQSTPVPGVFAAGDVACTEVKQAVVASAEGVKAALSVDKFLNKRAKVRFDYK